MREIAGLALLLGLLVVTIQVEGEPIDAMILVRSSGTCDIKTGFYEAALNAVPFK
jgi:hypothetical protein